MSCYMLDLPIMQMQVQGYTLTHTHTHAQTHVRTHTFIKPIFIVKLMKKINHALPLKPTTEAQTYTHKYILPDTGKYIKLNLQMR